ncbi:MAG: FAD:protein FMN transferase [Sulfurovum sp.]
MLNKIIYYTFISSILLFAKEPTQMRTQVIMGTFVSITLAQKDAHYIDRGFELLREVENSLSTYNPTASLSLLNSSHIILKDSYLEEALLLSKEYHIQTNGYFDHTIGSISKKLYHFGEDKVYTPSPKQLKEATLNIDGIDINSTHIRSDENITIDLGGMGKGYGVDRVALYFQEQNITEAIIALSGDIRCLDMCEIYLQSPYNETLFAKVTSKIPKLSISTSGTYRRYAKTKEQHHLINPKTASQGRDFISVSLFSADNNSRLDAFATAISVMPKAKALSFLSKHKEIGFILIDSLGERLDGNLIGLVRLEYLKNSKEIPKPSQIVE